MVDQQRHEVEDPCKVSESLNVGPEEVGKEEREQTETPHLWTVGKTQRERKIVCRKKHRRKGERRQYTTLSDGEGMRGRQTQD